MKKILMILVGLILLATPCFAGDVVITITIPDQHVARVQAAINSRLRCGELNAKACLKKELVRYIKQFVRDQESVLSQQSFESSHQEVEVN